MDTVVFQTTALVEWTHHQHFYETQMDLRPAVIWQPAEPPFEGIDYRCTIVGQWTTTRLSAK